MPRIAFYTLGCKVNQQETDSIRKLFENEGYETVPFTSISDIYIINTCTVTQMSDKKSRQIIARAHSLNPNALLVVLGCYAQRAPEEIQNLPGVHLVIGTQYKNRLPQLVKNLTEQKVVVNSINKAQAFEELPVVRGDRTRVQLKVQDGCDCFCSYCIIPYVRGSVRSKPLNQVKEELDRLGEAGVQEVVLTGIHLMSYGKDLKGKPKLADVVCYASTVRGIGRIRLGSLDPAFIDDRFVSLLESTSKGRLCEHFHLSLQSGSEDVLKRMNRKYTPNEYAAAAKRLRLAFPGCGLTTDIITGFPGETNEDYLETLSFVEQMVFSRIHVFPYSLRTGTKAANMAEQIEKSVKTERTRKLLELGRKLEEDYLNQQIGTTHFVLPEVERSGFCEGYTGSYFRVGFKDKLKKELVKVKIVSVKGLQTYGERV